MGKSICPLTHNRCRGLYYFRCIKVVIWEPEKYKGFFIVEAPEQMFKATKITSSTHFKCPFNCRVKFLDFDSWGYSWEEKCFSSENQKMNKVQEALHHIQNIFPYVCQVFYGIDGNWFYCGEAFNHPSFNAVKINIGLLEDAADEAYEIAGYPSAFTIEN